MEGWRKSILPNGWSTKNMNCSKKHNLFLCSPKVIKCITLLSIAIYFLVCNVSVDVLALVKYVLQSLQRLHVV